MNAQQLPSVLQISPREREEQFARMAAELGGRPPLMVEDLERLLDEIELTDDERRRFGEAMDEIRPANRNGA